MGQATQTQPNTPAKAGNTLMLPVRSGVELKQLLDTARGRLEQLAAGRVSVDRMIQVSAAAITKSPNLLACSKLSVLTAVMKAAELGLDCSGTLGSAYLVPYKSDCQLVIGYRGMIDLARRSGQVRSIEARVAYEGEEFTVELGTEPRIVHRPNVDDKPGAFRLAYAVAKLAGGGTQFEVMNKVQVDAIRQASPGRDKDPWRLHYGEMARKTVIRRLCKFLPLTVLARGCVTVLAAGGPR